MTQPIEFVGFWSHGQFRVNAAFSFSSPFGLYQSLLLLVFQKTTMFSRLSASKAALKSVGTATRTSSPSNSTVRVQANSGRSPILTFTFLQVRFLSSNAGRATAQVSTALLYSPHSLDLASSAIPRLSYRAGLCQYIHCWFDRVVYSSLWVASVHRSSSCQLSRRRRSSPRRLPMVSQRLARHFRSCQVASATLLPLPFFDAF